MLSYLSEIYDDTQIRFKRENHIREVTDFNPIEHKIITLDLSLEVKKPKIAPYYINGTVYLKLFNGNECELFTFLVYRSHFKDIENGVIYLEEVREEYYTWVCFYIHLLEKKLKQTNRKLIELIYSKETLDNIELYIMKEEVKLFSNSNKSKCELKELVNG